MKDCVYASLASSTMQPIWFDTSCGYQTCVISSNLIYIHFMKTLQTEPESVSLVQSTGSGKSILYICCNKCFLTMDIYSHYISQQNILKACKSSSNLHFLVSLSLRVLILPWNYTHKHKENIVQFQNKSVIKSNCCKKD